MTTRNSSLNRDEVAVAAMVALLSNPNGIYDCADNMAEEAVIAADALIAKLKITTPKNEEDV